MSDYYSRDLRDPRSHTGNQRDAAFSDIFGSAPPPGRSQTMTSSSMPPPPMPPMPQQGQGRTQTMSSSSAMPPPMQRQPPPRLPPQPHMDRESLSPRLRPMMDGGAPIAYPGQRSISGGYQVPSPQAQYLQQQQQRRAYGPAPPRPDSRGAPPQAAGARSPAQRFHQGGPGPAMVNDPYRSQSLASVPRPHHYQPPPSTYQQYQQPPSASAYGNVPRQQPPYGPGPHSSARTTAQGRVVPERHDDRSMSMTGHYPPARENSHPHQQNTYQTMSGRVIPNRRVPAELPAGYNVGGGSNGYASGGYPTPMPGSQTRTTSMASSTGDGQRSMSMASTVTVSTPTMDSDVTTVANRSSISKSAKSIESERPQTAKIRSPLVYPAMLSRVAECFRHKIITGDRTKNELTYKNAFSGAEAVDVLSYIIRTTDRNLALLLGRALDAQKFFHDVTYEHRLRDSTSEMYQFRETLTDQPEEKPAVNGVFVLLSECYSPTCTRDNLCYSIACPRRLEQVSRLNLKMGPGLKKEDSAVVNEDDADQTDEQKLWINSVPREIADKVDDMEKKRQEVISEICYTERDFVKDLEYLRDFWIIPLRSKGSPIPANRREKVVKAIFSNIIDHPSLHLVSSRFARALTERQQKDPVVGNVGDIFLEFAPQFEPFIWYGSKQLEAKHQFENEKAINPYFAKFVDEIERRKESRKLELNGYLTKPTTRLARYPLLLEAVLKHTEEKNADKEDIPKVLITIRDLLGRVNRESGKAENRFYLRRLQEQLRFRPNEKVDLKLTEDGREIIFKSQLKKTPHDSSSTNEITSYLFDHAVLLVRVKQAGKAEEVKAYRRPIPLELLSIKEMDEVIPQNGAKRSSSGLLPLNNVKESKKSDGWPITFRHLGKAGYELTLYAANQAGREKWLQFIDDAQKRLRARADFFNTTVISSGHFAGANQINCVTPCDGGRKLIYGTDTGIFVSDRKNKDASPKRVIETTQVQQVDVLEEYGLLLVLSNKAVYSYPLSALDPNEPALSKRPKKIQSHCNFFKTGICLGRHLVCCVKSSALSTTIKVYEPTDAFSKGKKQKGFGKMFSGQDELKPFKEFYIPTESSSVHFLKSKLCVACARGFEVVSLETLETQSLLDQADTSLDFVARKETVKPIHIERLNGEFLLNYSEFSFFVNRNGWRARPEWRIDWEGTPHSFALSYPWILAFEPNFIELRHIENGAVHIVPHKNIRMLHSSTHEILFAYEDEKGGDTVEALDFWKSTRRASELPPPPGAI
ncbi:Rho1 guanine nucleotide exchange factor 1 [Sodiomyces alkalinus F11]|uniref:Rho1 guanine nucleotide exchange factor 1 n=1 Tax=Sodiomyces alkalinus (strain CBS 110278 / VKM F-3762 / F11) TaxID=1314773 RepID=A0A3N2PT42_SODAK|nr:Rho1 guanine nucleotide exchange factor 1 [Sodiomyces alkalinus F11]ROT37584.1 Rho1 guanine nucleotide exchange factor 1 [Sodiomyces alkalinus F11]